MQAHGNDRCVLGSIEGTIRARIRQSSRLPTRVHPSVATRPSGIPKSPRLPGCWRPQAPTVFATNSNAALEVNNPVK